MDGILFYVGLGALGAIVGSFLNVVIHRLPIMIFEDEGSCERPVVPEPFNLAVPRSRCPTCGHAVRARENIPLISFAMLRGRCAGGGCVIPFRYPIVEILGVLAAALATMLFGISMQSVGITVFIWFAIAIAFIDIDHLLVPDLLSLPLLWIGLLINTASIFTSPGDAIIGAVIGYGAFWSIDVLATKVLRRRAIGQGDFKLFAAIGAWIGWQALAPAVLIASSLGTVVGGVMLWAGWRESGHPIGFAPFLLVGGLAILLSGDRIVGWLVELAGI